jgi:hypothetical protein
VQISTGESTWETPTTAAPQVPTPGTTPAPTTMSPYDRPNEGGQGNESGYGNEATGGAQEGERSLGVSHGCWTFHTEQDTDDYGRALC